MKQISIINNRINTLKNRISVLKEKIKDCKHVKNKVFDVIFDSKEKECILIYKEHDLVKNEIEYLNNKKKDYRKNN